MTRPDKNSERTAAVPRLLWPADEQELVQGLPRCDARSDKNSTLAATLFSAEQNFTIDNVVPVSASVKTKIGRGGGYED